MIEVWSILRFGPLALFRTEELFSCHHKIFTMILVANEMLQRLPMVSILCRKGGKQKQTAAMLKLNVERPVFS